jgi:hypothetical protein
MDRNWRHNADGLEDEKQREAHLVKSLQGVFAPLAIRASCSLNIAKL